MKRRHPAVAASAAAPSAVSSEYLARLQVWRQSKDRDLRSRDSWLALAGLTWLSEGRHLAGSDSAASIRLPPLAPARLGEFDVVGGDVYFRPASPLRIDGLPPDNTPLRPDTAVDPTYLRLGDLTLAVIDRGGRLGVRVWDNARLAPAAFPSRSWFDPDPRFVVEATFEPAPAHATVPVPDVTGVVSETTLLGSARFALGGRSACLHAIPTDEGRLWFLFGDPTNETTTYPAGRFLVAGPVQDGRIMLDFNRAYNPPCAFTRYATCPLPPRGNRLSVPIEAGETYHHGP